MEQGLVFALLVLVLLAAAVHDWRTHEIPNWLTYPAMIGGLLLWVLLGARAGGGAGALAGLRDSGLGLAAGLLPFSVLFLLGGLGGGDAKLMGAVGALSARWECVLGTAWYALLLAVVMAVVVMVRGRIVGRTLRRIFTAAFLSGVQGRGTSMPTDSPRIPFGVAIAVGGVLAGIQWLLGLPLPWVGWTP